MYVHKIINRNRNEGGGVLSEWKGGAFIQIDEALSNSRYSIAQFAGTGVFELTQSFTFDPDMASDFERDFPSGNTNVGYAFEEIIAEINSNPEM